MWFCLTDAFLSVVENWNDPSTLLVRARLPEDIGRVFPSAEVWEDTDADYRYRAILPRDVVAASIAERIAAIRYDNFKAAVDDEDRHDAYLSCWSALRKLQPQGAGSTLRSGMRRTVP
jgi:hypothetical protein